MTTPVKFLEGAVIYLRPRQLDDADWLYHSLNNDVEGRRLGGTPMAASREQIIANIQQLADESSRLSFAVVRQDDNGLVGGVVLDQIDGRLRSADFHIFIDAAAHRARLWHRGHAPHVGLRLRDIEPSPHRVAGLSI